MYAFITGFFLAIGPIGMLYGYVDRDALTVSLGFLVLLAGVVGMNDLRRRDSEQRY